MIGIDPPPWALIEENEKKTDFWIKEKTNPSKCDNCGNKLHIVTENQPWHDMYLICNECDSTYLSYL